MAPRIRTLMAILLVVLGSSLLALGQSKHAPPPMPTQQPTQGPPVVLSPAAGEEDTAHVRLQKEMAKKANLERQADLKRDTDKLLALATELKQFVDKSSENTLSLDVIRKAGEIEKLAHNVKEKMRGYN